MEKRQFVAKIAGTNDIFKDLLNKEFVLNYFITNSAQVHCLSLKDDEDIEIYFDPKCKISFTEEGIWIEGFAQIKNSIGNLSIIIKLYETNVVV
jgi:hypothetical protein